MPHAPDVETVLASERRVAAERAGAAPHQTDEAPTVPASWTSSPPSTPKPRPGLGKTGLIVAGAAAAVLVLASGGVWWMLRDREVPVSGATAVAPAAAPAPAPEPVTPTANPFTPEPAPVAGATPPAARSGAPTGTPKPGATPPGATARVTAPGAATPAPPATAPGRPPSKATLAQAATMLSEAQGLLQTGAEADGLARIAALRASFGGTAPAREGAVLAARTHLAAKRYDAAAAAWIDASRDGVAPRRSAKASIRPPRRRASAVRRRRRPRPKTLGEILDRYPASVRALRALQMKMSIRTG